MFVSVPGPHIPYRRVRAALDAHDLGFVLAQGDRIRLGLAVAVEVLELFAQQAPERLEAVCLRWVQRYAAEARGQQLADYGRVAVACNALVSEPEFATDELLPLCEERGLGR
jgi:hypothetical protein